MPHMPAWAQADWRALQAHQSLTSTNRLSPLAVGAGRPFGNGGDDFSWMDGWRVLPPARGCEATSQGGVAWAVSRRR